MADYLVTGKKGNGKSLVCVNRMREALMQGRRVATNLDLYLEHLLPHRIKNSCVIRVPDKPTREMLDALGRGTDSKREEDFGVLVLDELATWLNARTFGDKDRQGVLDWLTHSRKLGWETYLLAQHPEQVDKQVRQALAEFHVICRRMDRLKVPVLGLKLPRVHVGFVKFGMDRDSLLSERWMYRGNHLFDAYDTNQVFRDDYPNGMHSLLPPWHLVGRYASKPWYKQIFAARQPKPTPKPKRPEVAALMNLPPDRRVRLYNALEGTLALP